MSVHAMKLDMMVTAAPLPQIQALARDAAGVGFNGLVITEGGRTAYLSCAAAALVTELELATGIALAFPRSPMVTAEVAWELAEATGGRFRLGLGAQVRAHITRRYGVQFDPPGPRLREYVLAVKAIFRAFRGTEPLAFDGEWWSFDLLPAQWSPGPIDAPDPPIDIAAVNPWMIRMAAEVADGVHVHPLNSTTYLDTTLRPALAAGAAQAGRDAGSLHVIVPALTAVGDTDEEQARWRDIARMQIAFYGSTPNYAFIFDQLGFDGTTEKIRRHQKVGAIDEMARVITDDILEHFVVTATWAELGDKLAARYYGRADRVVAYFAGGTWLSDRDAFARWAEVTGAFKAAQSTGAQ